MGSGDTGQHVWTCAEYAHKQVSRMCALIVITSIIFVLIQLLLLNDLRLIRVVLFLIVNNHINYT